MTTDGRVRPRRGDLEAATTPHQFVPSGEFLQFGNRKERCDLCGLIQRGTRMHPEKSPESGGETS